MIGHGASEFGLDFLTSFFPQSAVSARVFVSAGQVPRLLDQLRGAVNQLEQRQQAARQQLQQNPPPPDIAAPENLDGTESSTDPPPDAQPPSSSNPPPDEPTA